MPPTTAESRPYTDTPLEPEPETFEGHPAALHLTPCTRKQYLELPPHPEGRYELVEGILIFSRHPAGALHLTRYTLEQYLELPRYPESVYELIDGILRFDRR